MPEWGGDPAATRVSAAVGPSPGAPRPAAGYAAGPWRAGRPRRSLGPVPVATIVGLELLALGALVAWMRRDPLGWGIGAVLVVAGVLLILRADGRSLGGSLVRRVRFAATRQVTRGSDDVSDPAVGDVPPDALGFGASSRARLEAAFPGVTVRQLQPTRGPAFGSVRWAGSETIVGVVWAAEPQPGETPVTAASAALPVAELLARCARAEIPLEAVTVVEEFAAPGELAPRLLGLRLRTVTAAPAIAARGGGSRGVDAVLAAVASLAVATLGEHGWQLDLLDADVAPRALAHLLEPDPDGAIREVWAERWAGVVGPRLTHRVLVATRWAAGPSVNSALHGLAAHRGLACVEIDATDPAAPAPRVRIAVRVADPGPDGAASAAQAVGRLREGGFVPVTEDTLAAVRATTPLGAGTTVADAAQRYADSVLHTWIAVPRQHLDSLTG